ncbi:MAG TPA: BTAD domain-containing putative transcriptional regulator [Streptosporangiaceae bacterium]|nr:BTAD domain-containing putative transcriptional regulator [Streptosporangiaceae bacterium]
MERVLAGLGSDPSGPITGIDAVRALRRWGVEYLRVADELEAAARCCRLAEREIGERIDAFLVDWAEPPAVEHAREPGTPASARRGGLEGWLRELLHRGRTGQERPAGAPVPARGTPPIPPKATLPSRPAGPASPRAAPTVPAADIAALVLGPLELSVAGRRVLRWNSQKAKAVLQYLLIHADRPVRRDVLMQLQWPDHTRSSARNNLNVALYSLRNTLDGPGQDVQPIVYQDGCYSLNPELTWSIDRNEFLSALHRAKSADRADRPQQAIDAYENAVRLYRGPLFEDDPVGDWFLPEQRHLEEQYLQALEHLATVYFELGQLAEAVRFGQLAVGTDPCCEPVHRLLMRCFDSQQQRQLVSRQYRSCVAALRDELGVPPGEETVQLFRSLTAAM